MGYGWKVFIKCGPGSVWWSSASDTDVVTAGKWGWGWGVGEQVDSIGCICDVPATMEKGSCRA